MVVFYLVDKSTASFVFALRELVIFVKARHPDAFPLELRRDSDRAWTITGRGENVLPEELAAYFASDEGASMSINRTPR